MALDNERQSRDHFPIAFINVCYAREKYAGDIRVLTCKSLLPAGGIITPALWINPSSLFSLRINCSAALLTDAKSAKSTTTLPNVPFVLTSVLPPLRRPFLSAAADALILSMASEHRAVDLAPTYTLPPAAYKIFASSNPTPDAAPVTMKTFPANDGRFFGRKVGAGGNSCVKRLGGMVVSCLLSCRGESKWNMN
jgi:hypothetical protein